MKRLAVLSLLSVMMSSAFADESAFDDRRIIDGFLAKQKEMGRIWTRIEPGRYQWVAQNGQKHRVGFGQQAKRVRADYLTDQIRLLESKGNATIANTEVLRMREELNGIHAEIKQGALPKSFGNCSNVSEVTTWVEYQGSASFCSVSGGAGFKIFNPTPTTTAYLDVEVFINTPSSDLKQIVRGNYTAISEGVGTDVVSLSASGCQDVGGYSRATFQSCTYEQAYSVGMSF